MRTPPMIILGATLDLSARCRTTLEGLSSLTPSVLNIERCCIQMHIQVYATVEVIKWLWWSEYLFYWDLVLIEKSNPINTPKLDKCDCNKRVVGFFISKMISKSNDVTKLGCKHYQGEL